MKSICSTLLAGVILASTLHVAAGAPTAPAVKSTRMSADGVELPAAATERKLKLTVPYAASILGEKPEELGRVFNVKKSEALLARHTTQDLGCDWFVINAEGADVVGLGLTDGRITKAVMLFDGVSQVRIDNMRKRLDAQTDKAVKVEAKPIEGDAKKLSLMLTFQVEPLEYYLATHPVDAKIATGLRQHTWVEGMTDEQATMVGDGPGRYAATFAADAPPTTNSVGAGTVFADNGNAPADVVIVIEARNKKEARVEALKRHKKLKDLVKISGDSPKPNPGK